MDGNVCKKKMSCKTELKMFTFDNLATSVVAKIIHYEQVCSIVGSPRS